MWLALLCRGAYKISHAHLPHQGKLELNCAFTLSPREGCPGSHFLFILKYLACLQ